MLGIGILQKCAGPSAVMTADSVSVKQWNLSLVSCGITPIIIGSQGARWIPPKLPDVVLGTYSSFAAACANTTHPHHILCMALKVLDSAILIADEVHTMPAPTFVQVCSIKSNVRVGMSATLWRHNAGIEKLKELIGPVLYRMSSPQLALLGYVSTTTHYNYRVPLHSSVVQAYSATASQLKRTRLAITNPTKMQLLLLLLRKHRNDHILIFCDLIDCIHATWKLLVKSGIRPLGPITGSTPQEERFTILQHFCKATSACLLGSRVLDIGIDLPRLNVLIKLSTISRSRVQEEQQNGRGARSTDSTTHTTCYTLISRGTREEVFFSERSAHLQMCGNVVNCVEWNDANQEEVPATAAVSAST